MRDGDLWEALSGCITKVKGHATAEMVTEGKVEAKDKQGNDGDDKGG